MTDCDSGRDTDLHEHVHPRALRHKRTQSEFTASVHDGGMFAGIGDDHDHASGRNEGPQQPLSSRTPPRPGAAHRRWDSHSDSPLHKLHTASPGLAGRPGPVVHGSGAGGAGVRAVVAVLSVDGVAGGCGAELGGELATALEVNLTQHQSPRQNLPSCILVWSRVSTGGAGWSYQWYRTAAKRFSSLTATRVRACEGGGRAAGGCVRGAGRYAHP